MKNFLRKISVLLFTLVSIYFLGCQEASAVIQLDDIPPSPVTNVSAVSEEGKIVVTWNDPSDTDLYGIKISDPVLDTSRKASLDGGILVNKGVQKYSAAGLENGKYYSFTLTAIDSSMNESTSVSTLFTVFNEKIVKVKTEEKTESGETKEIKKFVCPVDGKEYDTIEEAAACCEQKNTEVVYYVCPVCGKKYSTKQAAADCCKTPVENIPIIYINKEIPVFAPKYSSDVCIPGGESVTITSYFYEDSSVEGGLRYTKDSDEAGRWFEQGLIERGQFTVTSTSDGLKISTKVVDKYKNGSICIANLSLGWVQNVTLTNAVNVTKEGKDYIYPFVKPGDRYKVWFYFADENWANGWDGIDGSIEITAIGGIGNYAVTNNGYNFDNNSCSMYLKDFSVICPKDLLNTAILDKKQLSGNMYSNRSYDNGVGWTNQIYITNNCIDFSVIKNQILNVEDFFADVSYRLEYDGKTYECKIIGEYQYFTYTTEPQPFAVNVKGGTMEQQYEYLKDSIKKTIDSIKNTTQYKLPIIYVTTYDSADVLEKDYYDCYVEMFNTTKNYAFSEKKAGIKVRGNSTAQGESKPYRIKFDKKQNMLGLHEGKKYKSWVLLNTNGGMDYVGFNLARKIYESSTNFKYYASDCTFVHVYINGEYKGMRLLCEQSQVDEDRVDITELAKKDKTTLNTGYFMELDNYGGTDPEEPAFSLNIADKIEYKYQNTNWSKEKPLTLNGYELLFQNVDGKKVYQFEDILGHDILNGNQNNPKRYLPEDLYTIKSDTYSNDQIEYIAKWMNNVWEICYQAIVNKKLYRMDANHDLVALAENYSDDAAKAIISDYIDLESLMNEFILEELVRDNDVGAGSFYMAVDFTRTMNEKYGRLTFDCPWDFNWAYQNFDKDSEFFGSGPKYYAGAYQPMYVIENNEYDRSNFWFTLFNTTSWFRTMIRERWDRLPKEEIKTLCDTLKTKAVIAGAEGNFSADSPADFVKARVDEIDRTLWKEN